MDETGYVRRIAYKMLTEIASSFYNNEWSPKYELDFPFEQIIDTLVVYTRSVMKEIETYEQHLFDSPLMSVETMFAKYLSTEQRQVFKSIIVNLTNTVPTPFPTPYPSTDWKNMKKEAQESHGDLKKVLAMMTNSTGNPDEMTKLVVKVIANLNRLIQMFPASRAL